MSKKMDEMLPKMYADMHAQGAFAGKTWEEHVAKFVNFVVMQNVCLSDIIILDYGCGPYGGLLACSGLRQCQTVVPYDPYVELYSADPWKSGFTDFFSCDVLEHMRPSEVAVVCRRLCKYEPCRRIFLAITTRHANKTFPNGVNVHLTVQTPAWWKGFLEGLLGPHFYTAKAVHDMVNEELVLAFARREELNAYSTTA